MRTWNVFTICGLTSVVVAMLPGFPMAGQTNTNSSQAKPTAEAKTWTPPRTPHGDPDLGGVWNFATATPMERPGELAGRDLLTEQEAAEFETGIRENASADRRADPARGDGTKPVTSAALSTAAQLSP